jgi:hypothetical protein
MRRLAALAALALAACPGPGKELERAVRAYDDALVKAYATSTPSLVEGLAGRKEAERIRVLIDLKTNAGLVLESTLESVEVTAAKADGPSGTVETVERWRYHDRPRLAGAPPGPEIARVMRMRYTLVRDGDRWKVESVSTLSSDPLPGR